MKKQRASSISRVLVGGLALIALLALSAGVAFASTSADATIFNQVTVSYTSGTETLTAQADVSVTVTTLAAVPTVYVDKQTDTTVAGGTVVYTYTVRSNANGEDTYNLTTPVTSTDLNVTTASNTPAPAVLTLWGGIVVNSGAGTINLPGGSVVDVTINDTVELTVGGNVERYTVTAISGGTPESDGVAESLATLTLTPVGTSTAITSANVNAGAQVGEYQALTITQIAGTPAIAGTDGTHTTNLTLTTTATDINGTVVTYTTSNGDSNETVTTVSSPALSITKESRNVTTNGSFVSDGSTTAKPGEVIEYRIVITNTHATAAATLVSISDAVPTYTTLATNAGYFATVEYNDGTNTTTVLITTANDDTEDDASASGDAAGTASGDAISFYLGNGNAGTTGTGGTMAAGDIATILYGVIVN